MVLGRHTPLRPRRLFALSQLQDYHHPLQTPKSEANAVASHGAPHASPTDVALSRDGGSTDFLLDGPPLQASPPLVAPVFLFDLGDDDSAADERLDPTLADGDAGGNFAAAPRRGSWARRGWGRGGDAAGGTGSGCGGYDFSAVLPGLEVEADLSGLLNLLVLKEPPRGLEPAVPADVPLRICEDLFAGGLAQTSLEDLAPAVERFETEPVQGAVRPDADSPLPTVEENPPAPKEVDAAPDAEPEMFTPLRAPSLDISCHGDDKELQIFHDLSDSPTGAVTPPRGPSPPTSPVRPLSMRPMLTIITDPDHQEEAEDSDDSGSRPLSNCKPISESLLFGNSTAAIDETVPAPTEVPLVAEGVPEWSEFLPESPGHDKENDDEKDTARLLGPKDADESHTTGLTLAHKLKSKLESTLTTTPAERYQALLRKLDAEVARVDALHYQRKQTVPQDEVATCTPAVVAPDHRLSAKSKSKKYQNDPVLVFEPTSKPAPVESKGALAPTKGYQQLTSPTQAVGLAAVEQPPKSYAAAPEWARPGYLAASRQQRLQRFRGKMLGRGPPKKPQADAEPDVPLVAMGPSLTSLFLSSNIETAETTLTLE